MLFKGHKANLKFKKMHTEWEYIIYIKYSYNYIQIQCSSKEQFKRHFKMYKVHGD